MSPAQLKQPLRVAMLPALSELAGLIVLAFLFAASPGWYESRKGSDPCALESAVANILTPVFALGFLALPYLPWLADWIPALRLLAGPGRVLVWVIVLGQVAWLSVGQGATACSAGRSRKGPFTASVAIALVSLGVVCWSLSRLSEGRGVSWPPLIIAAAIAALIWVWSLWQRLEGCCDLRLGSGVFERSVCPQQPAQLCSARDLWTRCRARSAACQPLGIGVRRRPACCSIRSSESLPTRLFCCSGSSGSLAMCDRPLVPRRSQAR